MKFYIGYQYRFRKLTIWTFQKSIYIGSNNKHYRGTLFDLIYAQFFKNARVLMRCESVGLICF
jgi:hypothetical protein